ncbi:aflatoxin regulatory protein-domain-containing protein [Aspergillus keveii]|uniref:Aflatoxin regulatory protein-domain-containing protein n=1 Tax=Aspergillus keveii TaxID=714993 RepID=A0ABR4FNE2_9EURO
MGSGIAQSGTRGPTAARPSNVQQPRKLRESCSHCAHSKVRCTKEKPSCARCTNRRLVCEYKVSRRTGRTSRAGGEVCGNSEDKSGTSPPVDSACSCSNFGSSISTSSPPTVSSQNPLPSGSESALAQGVPENADFWRSFLATDILGGDVADFSSLIPMRSEFGDPLASGMSTPGLDEDQIHFLDPQGMGDLTAVNEPPTLPTPASSAESSVILPNAPLQHSTSCTAMILGVLSHLSADEPTACHQVNAGSVYSHPRPSSSNVSEIRNAMEIIGNVLHCPCSENGYVLSIASLAVLKAMSCYVAVVEALNTGDRMPSGLRTPSDQPGEKSTRDQIMHLAPTVHAHTVDGSDQNPMEERFVLNDLHRFQHMVNLVSLRLESSRLRTCDVSNHPPNTLNTIGQSDASVLQKASTSPLSCSSLFHLEDDIRQCLRAVSSRAIHMLAVSKHIRA